MMVEPRTKTLTKSLFCLGPYMAGSSNFALNYDYSQPAEIQPYNSTIILEAAQLLPSLLHLGAAPCTIPGLVTCESSCFLAPS